MKSLAWWKEQRSSTRLAFALQVVTRVVMAVLSLWWTSALLHSMGNALYGLFLCFQAVATLGGLGDLGMGAIIGLRVGKHLGDGTQAELKDFLAAGRAAFLTMGLLVFVLGAALSPWLPAWFGFDATIPGIGSLSVLFAIGAVGAGVAVFSSYIGNVNYGAVNVVWPVLPTFLVAQVSFAAHLLLARAGAPLTIQYIPYVAGALAMLLVLWWFVRLSNPELAAFWPLKFCWREWQTLAVQGFWSYMWGINSVVFAATARMLINAGFGPDAVPPFSLNNKLAELAFFFVSTAGFVSVPKLTQWLAAPEPEARQRVIDGFHKLNNVQAFLGCSAAVVYLVANNVFMTHWVGAQYHVPLHWQFAFALSLAVTSAGMAGIALSTRCVPNGLRYSGAVVGITAAANLVLSFVAMKLGSLAGIAFASAVTQSFTSLAGGYYICRYLKVPFVPWTLRNWVLPIVLVTIIYLLRSSMPETALGYSILAGVAGVLIAFAAWLMNIDWKFLKSEFDIVRRMLQDTRRS